MKTKNRDYAAAIVSGNWRIRKRLKRITAYAVKYGFLTKQQGAIGL